MANSNDTMALYVMRSKECRQRQSPLEGSYFDFVKFSRDSGEKETRLTYPVLTFLQ